MEETKKDGNNKDYFQHIEELPADNDLFLNPAAAATNYDLDFEEQCSKAADALREADVFLLVTGAGFSADSGLAVYADVARIPAYQKIGLEYHDICQPHFLEDTPEIFYGFWGQCFNDYRSTQPHEGYEIIRQWRDYVVQKQDGQIGKELQAIFERKVEVQRPFDDEDTQLYSAFEDEEYRKPIDAFYCFTSNVDAHSYDVFQAHEIYECHGNIELWQCSQNATVCPSGLWRAPTDYKFDVNTETMQVPFKRDTSDKEQAEKNVDVDSSRDEEPDSVPCMGHTKGQARTNTLLNMPAAKSSPGWLCQKDEDGNESNWPICHHCESPARPAILMFGDCRWQCDRSHDKRFHLWSESLLRLCEQRGRGEQPIKLCIIEIGCGNNVPTCRCTAEDMVEMTRKAQGQATLVRINPDFPTIQDPDVAPYSIPIKSRGLEAIRQINKTI